MASSSTICGVSTSAHVSPSASQWEYGSLLGESRRSRLEACLGTVGAAQGPLFEATQTLRARLRSPQERASSVRPPALSRHLCAFHLHLHASLPTCSFGGTDGRYHYNDTWAFDLATKSWSELPCTGYIPCPREGHAAALVDDIMYIFGGRGVDGANIGQLAAFKISTRRWFMFQNMGLEPSPRSGHGMAAVGSKVYVLGGVCEDGVGGNKQGANFVHILETSTLLRPLDVRFAVPVLRGGDRVARGLLTAGEG